MDAGDTEGLVGKRNLESVLGLLDEFNVTVPEQVRTMDVGVFEVPGGLQGLLGEIQGSLRK